MITGHLAGYGKYFFQLRIVENSPQEHGKQTDACVNENPKAATVMHRLIENRANAFPNPGKSDQNETRSHQNTS